MRARKLGVCFLCWPSLICVDLTRASFRFAVSSRDSLPARPTTRVSRVMRHSAPARSSMNCVHLCRSHLPYLSAPPRRQQEDQRTKQATGTRGSAATTGGGHRARAKYSCLDCLTRHRGFARRPCATQCGLAAGTPALAHGRLLLLRGKPSNTYLGRRMLDPTLCHLVLFAVWLS